MVKIKKLPDCPKPRSIDSLSDSLKEKPLDPRVVCYNQQKDLAISSPQVVRLVTFFLLLKNVPCREVICHFVDLATIKNLHQTFFSDPTPTDCISFPLDSPDTSKEERILGEAFVCPLVAKDYAKPRQLDPYREVSLYLVHSLLHLIGYTDTTPACRRRMRQEEKTCLCYLEKRSALLSS